jgi:AcrR family transcriptional regulator
MVGDLAKATGSRERILETAERLFGARGYEAVTLRDIALPLGLTHASLYYHFPGGKEELFAEVMERNVRRHGAGLAAAIEAGGLHLRGKLRGAAAWLISQPPMDLIRMVDVDLKRMRPEAAARITRLVYELVLRAVQDPIERAATSGEVGVCDAGLLAGGIVGMVESLHTVPVGIVRRDRLAMAEDLLEVILRGIGYREGD